MTDFLNLILNGNEDSFEEALNQDGSLNYFKTEDGIATCHLIALMGFTNIIIMLLEKGIDINCRASSGESLLHSATRYGNNLLAVSLVVRGIDINIKDDEDETALHVAAKYGHTLLAKFLVKSGIHISEDLNEYAPSENEDDEVEGGPTVYFEDARPTIFTEVEDRRKKVLFDSFINHYIEYEPYINSIYSLCNGNHARPIVGWDRAEALRDKYYFNEIFFFCV